jgi:hypothetical protein
VPDLRADNSSVGALIVATKATIRSPRKGRHRAGNCGHAEFFDERDCGVRHTEHRAHTCAFEIEPFLHGSMAPSEPKTLTMTIAV